MNRFLQIHLLTHYGPSNLNRDDSGRPKTAVMGGTPRLRVSSQSLKRAWRTSDVFKAALDGHIGTRTKQIGLEWIFPELETLGKETASMWTVDFQSALGEPEDLTQDDNGDFIERSFTNKQLVFVSPAEAATIHNLVADLKQYILGERSDYETAWNEIVDLQEKRSKQKAKAKEFSKLIAKKLAAMLFATQHTAADIALFGRMLASFPLYNVEAAAQVAHAIAVHKCTIEDDYFTAVDDLNRHDEDAGAGHVGEAEFGAAVFYLYLCVDRELLCENLDGDRALTDRALAALVEAATKVAPTGKQNSFASRARASYALLEKGDEQPRQLSVAFLKPVTGNDPLADAIELLRATRAKMDQVYGPCAAAVAELDALAGTGNLAELQAFAAGD